MKNIRLDNIESYLDFDNRKDKNSIDLSRVEWAVPIFVCALKAYTEDHNIALINVPSYLQTVLNGIYQANKSYSPVEHISSRENTDKIAEHIASIVLKNINTKTFSDKQEIKNILLYIFAELMNNVADHARSPIGGYAMAQFYKTKGEVQFAIADRGVGFLENVKIEEPSIEDECSAIKKATEPYFTASPRKIYGSTYKNAGYGLYALSSIIKHIGGDIVIISNDGLFRQQQGSITCKKLDTPFKGVLVGCRLELENFTLSYEEIMEMIAPASEEFDFY